MSDRKITVTRWTGFMASYPMFEGRTLRYVDQTIEAAVNGIYRGAGLMPGSREVDASEAAAATFTRGDFPKEQGEEVACVACGKLETRRHPGHFLCGAPLCREKLTQALPAARRALQLLSGLNLQDHSLAEQRECVEVVHLLLKATNPEKYGK